MSQEQSLNQNTAQRVGDDMSRSHTVNFARTSIAAYTHAHAHTVCVSVFLSFHYPHACLSTRLDKLQQQQSEAKELVIQRLVQVRLSRIVNEDAGDAYTDTFVAVYLFEILGENRYAHLNRITWYALQHTMVIRVQMSCRQRKGRVVLDLSKCFITDALLSTVRLGVFACGC